MEAKDETPAPERPQPVIEKFDAFLAEVNLTVDQFCDVLAAVWRKDARTCGDERICALLLTAADGIERAGFDFYVSTK